MYAFPELVEMGLAALLGIAVLRAATFLFLDYRDARAPDIDLPRAIISAERR